MVKYIPSNHKTYSKDVILIPVFSLDFPECAAEGFSFQRLGSRGPIVDLVSHPIRLTRKQDLL